MKDDLSFLKMLYTATLEEEVIILYLSHYTVSTREKISIALNNYLKNINILDQSFTITDLSQLGQSVAYYKNQGKYIINVFETYVDDNYDKEKK